MSKTRVAFEHSNYDYRVRLGTVSGRDSVHWGSYPSYTCSSWEDVEYLVSMWEATHDYPVSTVDIRYKGGCNDE